MGKHGSPENTPSASETKKDGMYGPFESSGSGSSLGYQKPATMDKKSPADPLGYIKGRSK